MSTPTDITVTVDMPGLFDSDLSGSSVGQGLVEQSGYDGAALLYGAYRDSRRISTGKGYRLRLTLSGSPADVADALYCLWHHADTYVWTNGDEPEYRSARDAAITMRDRTRAVAVAVGLDVSDWQ